MKWCICHFSKWQIHPFIYKGTICFYREIYKFRTTLKLDHICDQYTVQFWTVRCTTAEQHASSWASINILKSEVEFATIELSKNIRFLNPINYYYIDRERHICVKIITYLRYCTTWTYLLVQCPLYSTAVECLQLLTALGSLTCYLSYNCSKT